MDPRLSEPTFPTPAVTQAEPTDHPLICSPRESETQQINSGLLDRTLGCPFWPHDSEWTNPALNNQNKGGQNGKPPNTQAHPHRTGNYFILVGYQVLMRVGWIFKTESVIIPAVIDLLCGPATALAASLRSWLPPLNRIGQSFPQLFLSQRIRNLRQKKWVIVICSGVMGSLFLGLALIWHYYGSHPGPWTRFAFLLLYGLFFIFVGINNLAFNTLQGKLVPFQYRGRLMLFSNVVGGVLAIAIAWFLLQRWLNDSSGKFVYIFAFTGICFWIASLLTILLAEDHDHHDKSSPSHPFVAQFFHILKTDRQFRYLAVIAGCFGCSMVLFPHYQALYRDTLETSARSFSLREMISWVALQNAGTVGFSVVSGLLADRLGNRFVLRGLMSLITLVPVLAIILAGHPELARRYFFIVFIILGATPVVIRMMNHFVLELVPAPDHPRYLSCLSLSIALPVIAGSQIIGILLPIVGFMPLFLGVSGLVLVGTIFTLLIGEPRKRLT